MGDARENVVRLSLRRGETLVMASDGAEVAEVLARMGNAPDIPPAELASKLVESCADTGDDATVAVVRLRPMNGNEPS